MIPKKYSFRYLSKRKIKDIQFLQQSWRRKELTSVPLTVVSQSAHEAEVVNRKRMFLKLAGVVGIGAAGSLLLPKKASALVFGSAPANNVVGVKNSANTRIDPATEATSLSIKTATEASKIATDSIKTNTDTLVTNSNKFTFSGSSLLTTSAGGSSDVVGLKDSLDNRINPVSEDAIILLRRLVKLMESQATVDTANRQRVAVDAWGGNVATGVGTSAASGLTLVPRIVLATDSTVGTVTSVTNVVTIGSYPANQMFADVAHGVYANAIRRNLVFTN